MYDYEAELQKIADDVQKVHPIGEVKAMALIYLVHNFHNPTEFPL